MRQALKAEGPDIAFLDIAAYPPVAGMTAGFVVTPMLDKRNTVQGVMAIALPSQRIATLLGNPNGLGRTGDMFLSRRRAGGRVAPRSATAPGRNYSNAVVAAALDGGVGTGIVDDLADQQAVAIAVPVVFETARIGP